MLSFHVLHHLEPDLNEHRHWNSIGGIIQAWEHQETLTQEWKFVRVSRSGQEINTLLKANPHIQQVFKSYIVDGLYVQKL